MLNGLIAFDSKYYRPAFSRVNCELVSAPTGPLSRSTGKNREVRPPPVAWSSKYTTQTKPTNYCCSSHITRGVLTLYDSLTITLKRAHPPRPTPRFRMAFCSPRPSLSPSAVLGGPLQLPPERYAGGGVLGKGCGRLRVFHQQAGLPAAQV